MLSVLKRVIYHVIQIYAILLVLIYIFYSFFLDCGNTWTLRTNGEKIMLTHTYTSNL